MLGQSISKNSLLLFAFALATATVLAGTYMVTKEPIAKAEKVAAEKALLAIVPKNNIDNSLLDDTITVDGFNQAIHLAKKDGQVITAIIPTVAPEGYSGDIKLLIGVNADGTIAGVRALKHKETPGLGDKIDLEKSDWILSFNGRSLANTADKAWAVKKEGGEFDAFSGATITPRAVVNHIHQVLKDVETHRSTIFGANHE